MIAIPNLDKPLSCDECVKSLDIECCGNIRKCPIIDIVPCEECKWGDTGIDEEGEPFWKCIGIHYGGTKPTDFCSYGKRKNDEKYR